MKPMLPFVSSAALFAVGLFIWLPGSLPAQDSFDRSQLPIPDPPFKDKIGLTPAQSVKDFPREVTAPEGAPNTLLILTDDVGFGASSTFGGPIPTPRWTAYDAKFFNIEMPEGTAMEVTDRAYTSPIWYTPKGTRTTQVQGASGEG
jgi:hypothetical protein